MRELSWLSFINLYVSSFLKSNINTAKKVPNLKIQEEIYSGLMK